MTLKDINIGHSIRERVDASSMSYSEFARRINRSRTAIYSLFNCKIFIQNFYYVSRKFLTMIFFVKYMDYAILKNMIILQ